MQKLATIYLDNMVYSKGKLRLPCLAEKHGLVEEHLQEHLQNGWSIKAIHGFGGSADYCARGWVVVLLEK